MGMTKEKSLNGVFGHLIRAQCDVKKKYKLKRIWMHGFIKRRFNFLVAETFQGVIHYYHTYLFYFYVSYIGHDIDILEKLARVSIAVSTR